ncbi:hypothetical protein LCGC14_1690900 [marine sediment metagenome]|uniref:Uncharacterized protein n=1 Tax=marine sediment metagenome TaxID=412755 RepID=A0A0F9HKS0_9ZZZZ
MADLAALKAACDAAEAAKAALLEERASKRAAMPKQAFRDYNASTRAEQLAVEAAVAAANKEFQAALTVIRSDAVENAINVAVGTISEADSEGGMS